MHPDFAALDELLQLAERTGPEANREAMLKDLQLIDAVIGSPAREQKDDGDDERFSGLVLCGRAGVYFDPADPAGTEALADDGAVLRYERGCWDWLMRDPRHVRFRNDHNPDEEFGGVADGSLRLFLDDRGLCYEFKWPHTEDAGEVSDDILFDDVRGSSMTWKPLHQREHWEGDRLIRTVVVCDVMEVGPQSNPRFRACTSWWKNADPATDALDDLLSRMNLIEDEQ